MAAATMKFRLLHSLRNVSYSLQNDITRNAKIFGRQASSKTNTFSEDEGLPIDRKFDFDAESLSARGYLRNQRPYSPPRDVKSTILGVCKDYLKKGTNTFSDTTTKFEVLTECTRLLNHTVPNSLIHKITNVEELVTFYMTPVSTTVPLDMMKDMNLPKNLHVIYKYHRFHPETDTKFGGKTVFTKDSTLVTGLKYKKKYPGHITDSTVWPPK